MLRLTSCQRCRPTLISSDTIGWTDLLALLTSAGFSGPDALHIDRPLFGFLNGHLLNELQELVENSDGTRRPACSALACTAAAQRIPLLRGLTHAIASYGGATELEGGLDIRLTGLATALSPPT
jgi:hypothetical protein